MNNYDDYCTKLFGEHTCTEKDCPDCTVAEIISEHDKNLLDKVADMVLSLPKKYIDNFDYVACALILNGLEELKAEVDQ